MKVRKDFVTNSSSSSFIVVFDDKYHIEFSEHDKQTLGEDLFRVMKDVQNKRHSLSFEEAVSRFRDEMDYAAYFDIRNELESTGMSYDEVYDYCTGDNAEYLLRKNEIIDNWTVEFKNMIKGKGYIAEVEYDDHCDGDLEYNKMPRLNCTVARFSHH